MLRFAGWRKTVPVWPVLIGINTQQTQEPGLLVNNDHGLMPARLTISAARRISAVMSS